MARKFVLKAGRKDAMVPGWGVVKPGDVLEGDQYARFYGVLDELKGEALRRYEEQRPKAAAPVKVLGGSPGVPVPKAASKKKPPVKKPAKKKAAPKKKSTAKKK